MNASQPVTAIHRVVERCRADDYPARVARLSAGWVIMGERQVFPGYCLLLPDPVVVHLNMLLPDKRTEFLNAMALLGDAVIRSTGALRINYAMFGNVEPALHAHIIPRFDTEPETTRTAQPWAFDWNAAPEYSEAVHGGLRRRIAAELAVIALVSDARRQEAG